MATRKLIKSGASVVGEFPSLKMKSGIRYESTLERDLLYFLEFDEQVISIQSQPMTIEVIRDDGKKVRYTPDFLVEKQEGKVLVEVKPFGKLDDGHTQQQVEIGQQWAAEHDHLYLVVTEKQIRDTCKLDNLKILYRYARLNIPFTNFVNIQDAFARQGTQIEFGKLALILNPATPAMAKPVLWNLLFHHYLQVDLFRTLNDDSLISLWEKRGKLYGSS